MKQQNKPVILLTGPHGAGKDTVADWVCSYFSHTIMRVPRYTTRPRHEKEIDGKHYFFIDLQTFHKDVTSREYVEYAFYKDGATGTKLSIIKDTLLKGYAPLLVANPAECLIIKDILEERGMLVISTFITPSKLGEIEKTELIIKELKKRILKRGRSSDDIKDRLSVAKKYMEMIGLFDYIIENPSGHRDYSRQFQEILQKSRLR